MDKRQLQKAGILASLLGMLTLILPWMIYKDDLGMFWELWEADGWNFVGSFTNFVPMIIFFVFLITMIMLAGFFSSRRAVSLDKERQFWFIALFALFAMMLGIHFWMYNYMNGGGLFQRYYVGAWLTILFAVILYVASIVHIKKVAVKNR
ncbi:MAG: hypothetical protein FWG19_02330 [Methanomassiliicoccaceae archaeon]|nr:hypothetical protein [Methanomassiliicoccaceae archaeon]